MSEQQHAETQTNDTRSEEGHDARADKPFLGVRPSWALGAAVVLVAAFMFQLI